MLGRRITGAGALWAVAVSVKIYPVVFAPAFFSRRNWRGIPGAAASGIFLLVLPAIFYGPREALNLYHDFFRMLGVKGFPLHSHNQSFSALLQRLFTDSTFHLQSVADVSWTLWALPPALLKALALVTGMGFSFLSWKKVWRQGDAWGFLSAAAFSILFLSHIVWKDYLLFLFFPLKQYFEDSNRKQSLALAIPFLLLVTLSGPNLVGAPLATRLDAACIHLWAAVLVWIAWLRK
jgi:hypothetical protein